MPRRFVAGIVIAILLIAGSNRRLSLAEQGNPTEASRITFTDVTQDVGLAEPLRGMMGHAAAWGDADGDGRPDLYVGTFCDRPAEAYMGATGPVPNRLLRNTGVKFERVDQPLLELVGRGTGAVFADLDNDGDLDLYVSNNSLPPIDSAPALQGAARVRRNALFENDGQGRYKDVSEVSGACPPVGFIARNIGVLDFDGDGWLDLLVLEDTFHKSAGEKSHSVLLRNKGNLKFEIANARAALPDDMNGLGLAIADLNGDGYPDFYVGQSNRLFLSKGDGTYHEATVLRDLFAWKPVHNEDVSCGAAFGDVDRDGDFDLVVTNHFEPARNRLYLNEGMRDGVPLFRDVTQAAGLGAPVPTKCPHVEVADMDNDGWMDIYMSAIFVEGDKITPLIYHNRGVKDGLPQFAAPELDKPMEYSAAAPTADYDNDGDLDIAYITFFPKFPSRLLRNDTPQRHWLNVQVVGKGKNGAAVGPGIGATVKTFKVGSTGTVQEPSLLGMQEVATGYGYSSGQPAVCHFGLGNETLCDVEVTFPSSRRVTRLKNVTANQTLKVTEE